MRGLFQISTLRRWHRRLALISILPALLIFGSGLLLQWKKFIPSLQPNFVESLPPADLSAASLQWNKVLTSLKSIPEAQISDWTDISLIDIRPNQNNFRVRTKRYYEIQFSLSEGLVLRHGPKYAGFLVALHEGTFFGKSVKQFLFMPVSILFILLWGTGVLIFLTPKRNKSYET